MGWVWIWQANDSKGAILEEVPKEGEAMKMMGSAMVCVAASKEEVYEVLKNDIYAKNEVWDLSKVCLRFLLRLYFK
jgi:hypothetical protein